MNCPTEEDPKKIVEMLKQGKGVGSRTLTEDDLNEVFHLFLAAR